jgi:hypothetical protein
MDKIRKELVLRFRNSVSDRFERSISGTTATGAGKATG